MQKWKTDKTLFACPTKNEGNQIKKELDYNTVYREEFLECDPLRDWESFDRCKALWKWVLGKVEQDPKEWSVLDTGSKDCQFPEWLMDKVEAAIGLEYSKKYVKYAVEKGRPAIYGNVCNMQFPDKSFDFVFAHHLLGLVPDNLLALNEMFRVSKRYIVNLSQIPGNKRKHYAYMGDNSIFNQFIEENKDRIKVLYNDYLDLGIPNEYVLLVEKK